MEPMHPMLGIIGYGLLFSWCHGKKFKATLMARLGQNFAPRPTFNARSIQCRLRPSKSVAHSQKYINIQPILNYFSQYNHLLKKLPWAVSPGRNHPVCKANEVIKTNGGYHGGRVGTPIGAGLRQVPLCTISRHTLIHCQWHLDPGRAPGAPQLRRTYLAYLAKLIA